MPEAIAVTKGPLGVQIQVSLKVDTPIPPAVGANYFVATATTGEVQLLVGSVTVAQLSLVRKLKENGQVLPDLSPIVSHHFILSPEAFTRLRTALNDIAQQRPELVVEQKTFITSKE